MKLSGHHFKEEAKDLFRRDQIPQGEEVSDSIVTDTDKPGWGCANHMAFV